jgi:hypothetical protein
MATPKENFLRLMRNDNPKWLGDPWSCFTESPPFRCITFDAVSMIMGGPKPGQRGVKNLLGVTMDWPEGHAGTVPDTSPEKRVVKDITHWQDYVNLPDISNAPWHIVEENLTKADRENFLVMAPSFTGMFEFSHYMLGFEDALVNYLEEPDHMFDMLSHYTDWKIKVVGEIIDRMKPDIIHSHDDWGNKRSLFLSPKTWREMIKPHYERFYGYIKSRGVLIQHHADCVCDVIAEDMVDLGIDMWQGVIPQNDIKGVIERTEGKLCVMGGIDMAKIDFPEPDEEAIRQEVRRAIDTYMPLGSFIPCVPNIVPLYPKVAAILNDELNKYGAEYAAKHFN